MKVIFVRMAFPNKVGFTSLMFMLFIVTIIDFIGIIAVVIFTKQWENDDFLLL